MTQSRVAKVTFAPSYCRAARRLVSPLQMKSRSMHRGAAKMMPVSDRCGARCGAASGCSKEAHCRKACEHRDPKECDGLAFCEIGCIVDKVSEAPVADFLGGILDYPAAELMPRAAKGASFSKARAASRMLPANRSMKSAPDRCFSRACSSNSASRCRRPRPWRRRPRL